MRRVILWLVCSVALITPADAHDFWLQPPASPTVREPVTLTLQVGHGGDRQRSRIAQSRVTRFTAVSPDGRSRDVRDALHIGAERGDASLALREPGAHLLLLQTDAGARNYLPADRFKAYLEDEGLTGALRHRAALGQDARDGVERYSRHAKVIVRRPGEARARSRHLLRPYGLTLEIVPERDPEALSAGEPLPIRIFYRRDPLAGALVKLTDLANDAHPREMQRTDEKGRAEFAPIGAGEWLLTVVWTRPLPSAELEDYETSFASLAFALS